MAKYSLFIRPKGSPAGTRWQRVTDLALPRRQAIMFFQTALLNYCLASEYEPRLLPVENARETKFHQSVIN